MLQYTTYPPNWRELARACKERAGWKCEHCGVEQHAVRESRKGTPYIIYLHAAHKRGQAVSSPTPELLCLCIACHARYDYREKQRQARAWLEHLKHLRLLINAGLVIIQEWPAGESENSK